MYHTYIMANKSRMSYIGVTNNLLRRVNEHQISYNPHAWTSKYKCFKLVYYECFDKISDAIAREKQLKRWRRDKKVWLIERENPRWEDLSIGTDRD